MAGAVPAAGPAPPRSSQLRGLGGAAAPPGAGLERQPQHRPKLRLGIDGESDQLSHRAVERSRGPSSGRWPSSSIASISGCAATSSACWLDAYLVTSEVARLLILITPGSGTLEEFFREAAEPAAERVLPEVGPLDIERIAAAAERTGAVEILGPPPFGEPGA
jgi:hypothetical protein